MFVLVETCTAVSIFKAATVESKNDSSKLMSFSFFVLCVFFPMYSAVTFWNTDFVWDTQDTKVLQPLRVDEVGGLWKYSDLGGDRLIKLQSIDQCDCTEEINFGEP